MAGDLHLPQHTTCEPSTGPQPSWKTSPALPERGARRASSQASQHQNAGTGLTALTPSCKTASSAPSPSCGRSPVSSQQDWAQSLQAAAATQGGT